MDNEEIKKEEPLNETESDNFEDLEFVESTEDGEALPTKDVVKKIREDLKTCKKDKEEYLVGWQRAKADYINLQKEMDEVRINTSMVTKEKMVNNLLPALDSFEMAFANKESWEKVDSNWRVGVEYIYSQIMTGLSDSGIQKIESINIPFDPSIHQSIEVVETDDKGKDHTIEKIIQSGYKIGDRVIRPAKVNIYEYKTE